MKHPRQQSYTKHTVFKGALWLKGLDWYHYAVIKTLSWAPKYSAKLELGFSVFSFIIHPCFSASVRTLYSPITKSMLKTQKVDPLSVATMASRISSLLLEFLIAFEICISSYQRSHGCGMKYSAKRLWKDDAQPTSYQGHAIICHFMFCWWVWRECGIHLFPR